MPTVRELPPLRLSINIQPPSGSGARWASDERLPQNVPSDIGFTATAPGGFESFSCTLPRRPQTNYPDLERLSNVTVSGPSGIAWEGRLEQTPRVSGDGMGVSPSAVGWQAHLEDNKSARMVYVDRDLSRWGAISRARRLLLIGFGVAPSDGSVSPDATTGVPSLSAVVAGNASAVQQVAELLYDVGVGLSIGSIYYDFVRGANVTSSYAAYVGSDDNDSFSSATLTSSLAASASSTDTFTPSATDRYALVQLATPFGDGGTDGQSHEVYFRRIAVWGNHGLTKRGTAPDDGLYASDVVAHAVSSWAPLLSYTTGTNGSITPSTFIIPQLVFPDPTTAADIISTSNRFHLRDWFVWEGERPGKPTFYYHDRGARGRAWRARIGPSRLTESGPSMDRLWNGVIVRYQDVDGSTKTVGPTGATVDTTSALLVDTDTLNPANKLGIRRWTVLDMSGVSTSAGAIEVGRRFLEETKQFDTSGQAQIVGHCTDDRGVVRPAWQIRPGDTISFTDAADTSARRVVKTSYSDASKTNTIDLDAPPDSLAALLERLQVVISPLGL